MYCTATEQSESGLSIPVASEHRHQMFVVRYMSLSDYQLTGPALELHLRNQAKSFLSSGFELVTGSLNVIRRQGSLPAI